MTYRYSSYPLFDVQTRIAKWVVFSFSLIALQAAFFDVQVGEADVLQLVDDLVWNSRVIAAQTKWKT